MRDDENNLDHKAWNSYLFKLTCHKSLQYINIPCIWRSELASVDVGRMFKESEIDILMVCLVLHRVTSCVIVQLFEFCFYH